VFARIAHVLRNEVHPIVFGASAALILGFVAFTVAVPDVAASVFEPTQTFITDTFGWLMILAVAAFLVFCVWLAAGPYAKVRLGPDDSRPDYSNLSWFAMLFSAGMGIGLLFWGVAEPVSYYLLDPPGRRSRKPGRGRGRDAVHLPPLGVQPVGDLCRDRAGSGLLRLPPRPAAGGAVAVSTVAR
jgi:choline-glycine betaine transporter